MKWVKERDLLIAQTMEFVQSVTGKQPDLKLDTAPAILAADILNPRLAAPQTKTAPSVTTSVFDTDIGETHTGETHTGATDIGENCVGEADAYEANGVMPSPNVQYNAQAASVEAPRQVPATPRAIVQGDFRSEMRDRIANFRAHQERFRREREEYYSNTLGKARAGTVRNSAPPRSGSPS